MPEPEPPVIATKGLLRRFGTLTAVDGIDLELRPGECLGLLGPNGAGKSTTVRILSTLLRPSGGHVRVLGLDPVKDGDRLRARIGVVPQELALYDELSAAQNLRFFGSLHGLSGAALEEAVVGGLALAGLEERAGELVKVYSGGMKRRLNIAVALLHAPELVFLDEPTVGIDPQSRNRVFEMVEALAAKGVAMIYTSHQLGEVERLCDRIMILDRGRVVAEGTLAELQQHAAGGRHGSSSLTLANTGDAERAAEVLAAAGLSFAVTEDLPNLEDIFLGLTGHGLRDGGAA